MNQLDNKYYHLVLDCIREANLTIDSEWGLGRTWDELLFDEEKIEFKELYDLTIKRLSGRISFW